MLRLSCRLGRRVVAAGAVVAAVPPPAPAAGIVVPAIPAVPGIAAPVAAPPPAAGPRIVGPGGAWVVDEPAVAYNIGDIVVPSAAAVTLNTRALDTIAGEDLALRYLAPGVDIDNYAAERKGYLASDRRTLPQPSVVDASTVPQLVKEMTMLPGGPPSPIEGGAQAPWFLQQATESTGTTFGTRHHRWLATSGVKPATPLFSSTR